MVRSKSTTKLTPPTSSPIRKPLVFVSHDTRDREIAEAFCNLLADVSGSVLQVFRSSDRAGTTGIEFGADWYNTVMEKLDEATDLVALLTEYSLDRPWILYETGVVKGRTGHKAFGLALGITLEEASVGPFAQLQNSDDDKSSLTKLVFQLMRRNLEVTPRAEAVEHHVDQFMKRVAEILSIRAEHTTANKLGGSISQQIPTVQPRRIDEALDRGSSRFLEVLVDGALYLADTTATFHEGLKKAIQSSNILPMKYLYCTDDGCEFWLELVRQPEYRFYTHSLDKLSACANDVVATIQRVSGESELDLISLGSGNGEKDNRLLRELCGSLRDGKHIYYYPIDINSQMLVQSVRGALNGVRRERLLIKAIVGDISRIQELSPVYEDRAAANIFSVLGNTIGNSDERTILRAINAAMLPGDFLLAEVSTQSDGIEDFLTDELNMKHDFVPLQSLGVPFEREKLTYERVTGLSVVPDTVSTLARYSNARIGERPFPEVKLSVIHHYDPDQFSHYVVSELGVERVTDWRFVDGALFLFRRPKSR